MKCGVVDACVGEGVDEEEDVGVDKVLHECSCLFKFVRHLSSLLTHMHYNKQCEYLNKCQ